MAAVHFRRSGPLRTEDAGAPVRAPRVGRVDIAQTSRPARPLLSRLAAASPWSRGRIAGESVLLLVLAGIAGAAYATESGSAAKGWAVALLVGLLSLVRRSLPATVLVVSSALAGSVTYYHTQDDVIPNVDEDFVVGSAGIVITF